MHLALATSVDGMPSGVVAAFAAEPFSAEALAADAARIEDQIASTLDALKRALAILPGDLTADSAALILSRRIELIRRAHAITEGRPEDSGLLIRIHGDYHLGQVLRARGDYVILDFEGEPARTLAERRAKRSPLRDVAGMLRSFSYASHAALERFTQRRPGTAKSLEPWAHLWLNAVVTEFLTAWRITIAADPHLTPQPLQAHRLLVSYQLEKALYELLYELNNRPAWVRIPLAGILALLRESA
jgi:maltose alpha-D-glucosyltransferase/alpha-amylase